MADEPAAPWHAITVDAALARVGAPPHGLSSAEAADRLARHGPNRLGETARRGPLRRLAAQFNDVLIHVLLVAGVVTLAIGHATDAAVIFAVVVINAVIGFVQEGRAEDAMAAIRAMVSPRASVIRDGVRREVDAAELVPGDVVVIEAGDRVPADIRLLKARALTVEEAALTGESVPAGKAVGAVAAAAPLGDRVSMAFSGTFVAAGQGTGVVVATGAETELGRVGALVGSVEAMETPLTRQMRGFARMLTAVILAVSAAVFAVAVLARGYALDEAFLAVVGLAVAAVPEGLPAVMTITLAIGVRRMARRNAIIRRLPAVETLGAVSVICTDKTGTLTRNEMMVADLALADRSVTVTGNGYEPRGGFLVDGAEIDPAGDPVLVDLVRAGLLCNDAALREVAAGEGSEGRNAATYVVAGDPMEGAFVALAVKAGLEQAHERLSLPRRDEIPFDARHRLMATLHHDHAGGAFVVVKGAPERLIELAACERSRDGDRPIDRVAWTARADAMAARGERVLALAVRTMPVATESLVFADVERDLCLLGLAGMIDPPRAEAVAAVADCRSAGIAVKMITGDHALTARAIAEALGLDGPGSVVTGAELERLDPAAFSDKVHAVSVFARTSPEQKLRIVEALQARGAIVAMTGDGVNDAPALKRADVGVAMGRKGTEAAKEASEMVIADDDFASIVAAVKEGRTVYDNLTKVIAWTLPTDGGEGLAVVAAILVGATLPMTPLQILWINMVTAVTLGLTLTFEPAEPNVMRRPPRRPDAPLLSGFLIWRTVLVSLVFLAGIFGVFQWALARGEDIETARTLVVNTIVVMEIAYLFSIRYLHMTALTWTGVLGTRAVLTGIAIVTAAQLALTYLPPLQQIFDTRPVGLVEGLVVLGIGAALLAGLEVEKLVRRRLLR